MRLPLDLNFILNINNILHFKFSSSKAKELLKILQIEKLTETDIGIISKINGQFIIFYDEKQFPLGRKRFTFAHEIGHFYLNHHSIINTTLGRATIYKGHKPQHETEADMFASRILAPLFILKECKVSSVEDVMKLTGLSKEASLYRFKRLQEVNKRNKFYTHPAERKIYKQFEAFIKEYNAKR